MVVCTFVVDAFVVLNLYISFWSVINTVDSVDADYTINKNYLYRHFVCFLNVM